METSFLRGHLPPLLEFQPNYKGWKPARADALMAERIKFQPNYKGWKLVKSLRTRSFTLNFSLTTRDGNKTRLYIKLSSALISA